MQYKFAFVDCEFHVTNPLECEWVFEQTVTDTLLSKVSIIQ